MKQIDESDTDTLNAPYTDVEVKTVIWKQSSVDNNRLFWCDHSYNILKEDKLENNTKKTNCSLYIASKRVEAEKNNNTLDLLASNPDFVEIERWAREKKDAFLLNRADCVLMISLINLKKKIFILIVTHHLLQTK